MVDTTLLTVMSLNVHNITFTILSSLLHHIAFVEVVSFVIKVVVVAELTTVAVEGPWGTLWRGHDITEVWRLLEVLSGGALELWPLAVPRPPRYLRVSVQGLMGLQKKGEKGSQSYCCYCNSL